MTGDRARTAPEMTPAIDVDDDAARIDRRGVVRDSPPGLEPTSADPTRPTHLDPGETPGLGGPIEGRTELSDTTGAERTDEGGGSARQSPSDGSPRPIGDDIAEN
jgi:hypothetical protein